VPPRHHVAIEIGQLVFAFLGLISTVVLAVPLFIGFSLVVLSSVLVGVEALSRLRSRRFSELVERIEELEDPGEGL
jgi:hypothetical protein